MACNCAKRPVVNRQIVRKTVNRPITPRPSNGRRIIKRVIR